MAALLDRDRLIEAFERLGADLAERGVFVELAVHGGGALLLLFEWRRTTDDVHAVVREAFGAFALAPSVPKVAAAMGVDLDWLQNAVTPLDEADGLFAASGTYPTGSSPGLRIFIAKPCYLLAMKLQALANLDRGDRDLDDARALARHLGLDAVEALHRIYRSIYDEEPPIEAQRRFAAVFSDIR